MNPYFLFFPTIILISLGCKSSTDSLPKVNNAAVNTAFPTEFNDYWFNNTAEVNAYNLRQARYGETRAGDAVLVFVTEDFSKEKQVKLDHPDQKITDALPVLKMNFLKKFKTGIYDYATMQSVFTPIDVAKNPKTTKANFSSQDWCGQVFSQLNLQDDGSYRSVEFSYFENEGDQSQTLDADMLEDEIWTRLRINPEGIPTGKINLIPSLNYVRFEHVPLKPAAARITLDQKTEASSELRIEYLNLPRTLKITFDNSFPFRISGWEEQNGKEPVTKATLKRSINAAYWNQNGLEFKYMRDSLLLK